MEGPAIAVYLAYYWNTDQDDEHRGGSASKTDFFECVVNQLRSVVVPENHIRA